MMEDGGLNLFKTYYNYKLLKNKKFYFSIYVTHDSTQVTQSLIGYKQLLVGLILIIFLMKKIVGSKLKSSCFLL